MRYSLKALLFVCFASLLLACGSDAADEGPVMFRVGPKNVTETEFSDLMERLSANIVNYVQQTGENPERARQLIFEEMVNREVFLQEAQRQGYGVEAEDTEELEAFFRSQINKPEPTAADFEEFARQSGFDSYNEMWADYSKVVALDNYAQDVSIPGASQQVNARHILVLADRNTAAEEEIENARAQAEEVLQQLREGADFATLAAEYSEDPGSAANGGELGWNVPEAYVPEFAQAVSSLEIGETSELIQTDFGYHIVQVTGRRSFDSWGGMNNSPEGREFINQVVEQYKQDGELQIFIDPATIPLPASVTSSQ